MANMNDRLRAEAVADWSAQSTAWDRWADRLNLPLMEAAEIRPGQSVLDLASGTVKPALSIAARVGADGLVLVSDIVPEMLAGTRRRASDAGCHNMSFLAADMAELPLASASVERVTCRFGLMFTPEPGLAMAEALRVLRPGGIAAWMAWGPIENNTTFLIIDRMARRLLGGSFLDGPLHPFRFSTSGDLSALLAGAGFSEVFETELRFSPRIDADQPFWLPTMDMIVGPDLARVSETERRRFAEAVAADFAGYRSGEHYRIDSHVRLALGTQPA